MGWLKRWDARNQRWVEKVNARHAENQAAERSEGGPMVAVGAYLSMVVGLIGLVGLVIEAIGRWRERASRRA